MAFEIRSSRLLIREWIVSDANLFFPLSQDPAMSGSHQGKLAQASLEDAEKKIIEWALLFGQTKMGILPIFLKNQKVMIGICGIKPLVLGKGGLHFEVICRIGSAHQKQGYASEVVPEILNYAFKKLGLKEVVGVGHPDSQRLLEKSGMSFLKSVTLHNKKLDLFSAVPQ